jgi:hypothetical protein
MTRRYHDVDVQVHGGLTYSDSCNLGAEICHVPAPGQPDDVWWLGWDCGHFMDVSPYLLRKGLEMPPDLCAYRDIAFVRSECAHLAYQAQKAQS